MGKHNTEKKIPNFSFPITAAAAGFLRPTAITAVSLRSGGKGVLKERCTGRDVTPVLGRYLFSRTRNAMQTPLLIKLQLYFTTASQHP